jgi:flagellar hook-basal body complex protein FliE
MSTNMEIDRVLAQIRAISAQTQANGTRPAAAGQAAPTEFANVLRQGIDQVNQTQQRAGELAAAFERGTPGVELPQVMLEMQKASVSFRAITEVRNRLVNAYQEIMNMPI